jgi:hypothetical protein
MPKEIEDKKREVAEKMKKRKSRGGNPQATDEGDFGHKYVEDNFSKKDIKKEKEHRKENTSMGKNNANAWDI